MPYITSVEGSTILDKCQAWVPDEANGIAHTGRLSFCVVDSDIKQPPSQELFGVINRLSYTWCTENGPIFVIAC